MNPIFQKLWETARLYYEKGRPKDVEHIKWMMPEAMKVCEAENIDEYLLIPLVILHDIGYSKITTNNPFLKNERINHMEEGAKLSEWVLNEINFPLEKRDQIVKWIAIHDIWAFNAHYIYRKDKVLGCFNDLDFIWMVTPKGFIYVSEYLKKKPEEMLDFVKSNEKIVNRPFCTKTTQNLYNFHLKQRIRDIDLLE